MTSKQRLSRLAQAIKPAQKMTWKEFIQLEQLPADMLKAWERLMQKVGEQ